MNFGADQSEALTAALGGATRKRPGEDEDERQVKRPALIEPCPEEGCWLVHHPGADPGVPPKGLRWNKELRKYEELEEPYNVMEAEGEDALLELSRTLQSWLEIAKNARLRESAHIIQNMVEELELAEQDGEDNTLHFLIVRGPKGEIIGASIYEIDGTIEGVPFPGEEEAPEEEPADEERPRWIYVSSSVAHPISQLPAEQRADGALGGAGGAMYHYHKLMGNASELPIRRWAENQRSVERGIANGYKRA